MKQILILTIVIFTSCSRDREQWKPQDWIPVMVDGGNNKYWDYSGGSPDTLHSGQIFNAKIHMPLKEFEDSLGNRINVTIKRIDFDVKEGSTKLEFRNYIRITYDTGIVRIPVDTLMNKFKGDNLRWEASLWVSNDTTYIINGDWHLSRDR